MTKLVQAFLTGAFFTFILDFFIFLGIKENYVDFYEIDLYYNVLFADNQNGYLYLLFTAMIGYVISYVDDNRISLALLGVLFSLAALTLVPSLGHKLGTALFTKEDVTYKDSRHTFVGDEYYNGRKNVTFFDYELQKIITLEKKELIK